MKTYTIDEMKAILESHQKWLNDEDGGSRADLSHADLSRADLSGADLSHFQIPAGDLIVFKKASGHIITLAIPKDAPRTASLIGRKCRAAWAMVLETDDGKEHVSDRGNIEYIPGQRVDADSFDDDPRIECSHGIHFFLTRKEAEEWKP